MNPRQMNFFQGACHTSHCPPCHPCYQFQPVRPHACHPLPQTPTQSQPDQDHTTALNEIKKAIGNVTECILNIADVIVKSRNDTEENKPAEDLNIAEETLLNKSNANLMNEDVNDQNNESFVSFDETVPELPNNQASLNCQATTIQLL